MKVRKSTLREHHVRRVGTSVVPVRDHQMRYWSPSFYTLTPKGREDWRMLGSRRSGGFNPESALMKLEAGLLDPAQLSEEQKLLVSQVQEEKLRAHRYKQHEREEYDNLVRSGRA